MIKKVSFSQKIKEELICNVDFTKKNSIKIFVASICRNSGSILIYKNKKAFSIHFTNIFILRKFVDILNNIFSLKEDFIILEKKKIKLKKTQSFDLIIQSNVNEFLDSIYYYSEELPKKEINKYFLDYLKGIFIANGSINNLNNSNYHLEFYMSNKKEAEYIYEKFYKDYEIPIKKILKKDNILFYLKDSILIGDLLYILGGINSRFEFEDVRITRDMKNSMNRIINCEIANEQKILNSSKKHINNINIIKTKYSYDYFSFTEKKVVEARKKYPELSLKDLSDILKTEYKLNIGKSGLNHIFRKLEKTANVILSKEL